MTKEIIIDGVNVAECKRRIGKNSYCRYFKRPCADNNFNCIWKQQERLKAENEKLKEENHYLNRRVKGEIHLGNCYKKDFAEETTRAETYKQALEEIREITKSTKQDICNNCGWKNTDSCEPSEYICGELNKVLNKINEVLNG